MNIRFACLLALLGAAGCCRPSQVHTVDLSTARVAHVADDEAAWRSAAVMPFEETGRSQFIWDDQSLSGRITKHDKDKWTFDPDERICVSVYVDQKIAKLYFKPVQTPGTFASIAFEKATVTDESQTTPRPLDAQSVQATARADPARQGTAFSLQFSLRWSALTARPPQQCHIVIEVYRIVPQRSESRYVVSMKGQ